MNKKVLSLFIATVMIILLPISSISKAATNSNNNASQIITALGVMENTATTNLQGKVTRAQFAKMLVNMSSFKDTVSAQSNVSLFKDVSKKYWASGYIKVAISNQWMSGYLDGKFKPSQSITLQEAVNATVILLGYSNSDFTGNKNSAKMLLYYSKNLDENISKSPKQYLTRTDCINLFYNTLKATKKDNSVYAASLGYTIDSSGEINYLELVNKNIEGPVIAGLNLAGELPFSVDSATYYRNGVASDKNSIQLYDVLYYSVELKTVWAYSEKVTGTLKAVAPNSMSPTSITIAGKTYTLGSQEMSYEFSTLGGTNIGDVVTILLGKDGTVVEVLDQEEYNSTVNGVVLGTGERVATDSSNAVYTSTYATVVDSYGREFEIEYDGDMDDYVEGQIVAISYTNGDVIMATNYQRYQDPISGTVNIDGSMIGTYYIAPDARILDTKGVKYTSIPRSRLAGIALNSSDILFYSMNSNGEIEELILKDVTGDLDSYGVISNIAYTALGTQVKTTYTYIINGTKNTYTSDSIKNSYNIGASSFSMKDNVVSGITNLTGVMVTSIEGVTIKNYNTNYTMSDEVAVYYLKDSVYEVITLSNVSNLKKYNLTAYYDKSAVSGGRIRVIIAQDK